MNKFTLGSFLGKTKTKTRTQNYLKVIMLLLVGFIGIEGAMGQTYEQVTTIGGLVDGDYLVVGDGSTNDGIMLNTITPATPYINRTSVTNPGSSITTGFSAANVFQIAVVSGNITIYNSSIGYVSWGRTGNIGNTATFFSGTVADSERWTPTVSGGLWTLANVGTAARSLQWNNSAPRFACYTSTQVRLKLYKLASVPAPVISATTPTSTTVLTANANIYTVTASNTPTSFAASGLPTGLSISSGGAISGTPATGTASVTAYTVGLTATNAAGTSPTVNLSLTINKANQTITFTPTLSSKVVGATAVPLTATASSGLTVSYATSDSGVASLSGSSLSFVGAGTATITASQAGNTDYNAATNVTQSQVVSAAPLSDQTISFTLASPVTYGASPITLAATSTSGLTVSYSSSDPTIASISGSTLTVLKAGSVTITASQAGDGSYNAATNVQQNLVINTKALTITGATASDKVYDGTTAATITDATLSGVVGSDNVALSAAGATFASATAGSGIAVSTNYTLINSTATNYTVSQPTGLTAAISQASQSITFGTLATLGIGSTVTLSATGGASGNAVTYTSSDSTIASVSGSIITGIKAGTVTITASQLGNSNYTAAADVPQSLTVAVVPVVIAGWDFSTLGGGSNNFGASPLALTTTGANSTGTGLIRGSGIASTGTASANAWGGTNIINTSADLAITNNRFVTFTVKANAGRTLSLSSISTYNIRKSSTGATSGQWQYSLDGTTFTNIGSAITWGSVTSASGNPQAAITLSGITALQNVPESTIVTFRLVLWGGAFAGTGTWYFNDPIDTTADDLVLNGTIAVATSTTWNGSAWTSGAPSASIDAIIAGDLSSTGTLNAKNLTVNATRTLTVASGSITVAEAVVNNGTIIVENNANFIQTATGADTNTSTGTVTVKRNSNSLKRLDYTMWSSPVTGQNLLAFSPLTSAVTPIRFYQYNPLSDKYVTVDPQTNSFLPGRGYLIRMPNEKPGSLGTTTAYYSGTETLAYPGVFTGTLNNGTINLSLLTADKYVSVGNPYPSAISADLFLIGNSTAGTLYFWRKTNGAGGTAYATYTYSGGVGTGDPKDTGITPNGTIEVGQGFIVKATSTALNFTNSMRTTSAAQPKFFKTKKVADKSRVWLSLSDAKGGLNQAMIAYIDGATQGVDAGYDGKYFNDSAIALTSTIDSEEYVIQARPIFDATDVVALGFKTDVAGDYSIALDSFDGVFESGQDVYLVDAVAGKEIDLKAGSYSFTATAGVDNARFSLKYQKTLKVDAPAFNENSVKVYKNNGAIVVNSTAKAIKTIAVYDIQGRLLAQQKNVNATTATISNLKAAHQVLIVKISADDNSSVSKKVLN